MANVLRRREAQGQGRELAQTGGRGQQAAQWDPFRAFGLEPFRRMRDLLAWDPLGEIEALASGGRAFMPDLEVRETKDAFQICADLPGVREQDVEVNVSGNRLTISGKREEEQREEGDRFYAYERSYGSFSRSFTLPEGVNADQIEARLENGVLEVRIPKAVEQQSKRIPVRGGGEQAAQAGARAGQTQAGATTTQATQAGREQGGSREKAA
jgi:HSP20 family protein